MSEQNPDAEVKPYELLVGLDFSELSERAFETAVHLSALQPRAELHVVIVGGGREDLIELPGDADLLTEEHARERAVERVGQLVEKYRNERGRVPLERVAVYVVPGDPARQILALADALDVDIIVVGTHGRKGVNRLFLGSVAEQVVRGAATGVYVVRPRDFIDGERVPAVQPPLGPGEPHLKPFVHRRTYHYVDRNSVPPPHTMPVT